MTKPRLASLLSLAALWVAAAALWLAGPARADSWPPPMTKVTLSANGQFRFTVEPASRDHPSAHFAGELEAARTGTPAERPAPVGLLERRDPRGKWEPVWAGPLVNAIAPTQALVADDGRHVVTFDNWYGTGHADHVIVIYGPGGGLVRSLALTDLAPQDFIDALPHSVSSIMWREREGFTSNGGSVAIAVPVPGQEWGETDPATVTFTVALADGAVTLPPSGEWEAALSAAAEVAEAQRQAEAERIAYLTNPLTVPQGCREREWHAYLREAHARTSTSRGDSTWTTVLLPRAHPRHRESVGWLRKEMLEDWEDNAVSAASPCDPDGLVEAVSRIVRKVRPGRLANLTMFVAAPEAQFAAIARLLAPTGAKAVRFDPAAAIPQRPDRIPGAPEEAAAQVAGWEELAAEFGGD
jgi:hypothetical protein